MQAIDDKDELYRRIHPLHVKPDNTISSAAFKGSDSEELSVDLVRLTSLDDVFQRAKRLGRECAGVGLFQVSLARGLSQEVRHDPLDEAEEGGPNPAHSLVVGKKTDPIARKLARASTLLHPTV